MIILIKIHNHNNNCVVTESMQDGPLYIPFFLKNRTMKLLIIYSTLHISLYNIFVEKEKYHEL